MDQLNAAFEMLMEKAKLFVRRKKHCFPGRCLGGWFSGASFRHFPRVCSPPDGLRIAIEAIRVHGEFKAPLLHMENFAVHPFSYGGYDPCRQVC
jgi:hypothetical protein